MDSKATSLSGAVFVMSIKIISGERSSGLISGSDWHGDGGGRGSSGVLLPFLLPLWGNSALKFSCVGVLQVGVLDDAEWVANGFRFRFSLEFGSDVSVDRFPIDNFFIVSLN